MKSQAGFSLMEVLVAIAMISVAIIAASHSNDLITKNFHNSRDFVKAHTIGTALMEELLSVYNSDPKLTPGQHSQNYDRDGRKINGPGPYTATWDVQDNTPLTSIREIRLRVNFNDGGTQRGVHFHTFRGT